ncbi:hypothetical protein L6452_26661 [Arctium lappa]|uniref:Uncharacterized protein n=1 Tax=Arctium lappa TaxID=4217 RepID=A0ACB8ZV28_ARCLA|nr:hypothetical protein L6452_26661 [Arctium lappa]
MTSKPPPPFLNSGAGKTRASQMQNHFQTLKTKMLRRKPTKIEVNIEDKEELEQSRKRATATTTTTTTGATSLLHHFNNSSATNSKSHRIGLSS